MVRVKSQGSEFKVQGSKIKVQMSKLMVKMSRVKVQRPKIKVQRSKLMVKMSMVKTQGFSIRVQEPGLALPPRMRPGALAPQPRPCRPHASCSSPRAGRRLLKQSSVPRPLHTESSCDTGALASPLTHWASWSGSCHLTSI